MRTALPIYLGAFGLPNLNGVQTRCKVGVCKILFKSKEGRMRVTDRWIDVPVFSKVACGSILRVSTTVVIFPHTMDTHQLLYYYSSWDHTPNLIQGFDLDWLDSHRKAFMRPLMRPLALRINSDVTTDASSLASGSINTSTHLRAFFVVTQCSFPAPSTASLCSWSLSVQRPR